VRPRALAARGVSYRLKGVTRPVGEGTIVLFRSVLTFLSLLIFARLLGKTQISQLSFFEWVTGITLGSIAGELTIDLSVRPWPMYVGLLAWTGLTLIVQGVTLKSRWVAKMVDGEPVVVIQNGQILEGNLRLLRMREGELTAMLRAQGIFDLAQVEFAVLEPRGELSILKRSQDRPVTPADLQLPTAYEGLGIELVVDGEVMEQNLRRLGVNRAWLYDRLGQQGVQSPKEVFLAVLDTQGKLYIDRYTDRVPPTDDFSDYPGPN
jgi:uncharacterized membrane protein YcaP (DUF421 family)